MEQANVGKLAETFKDVDIVRYLNRTLPRLAALLRRVQGLNCTDLKTAAYTATSDDDLILVDTTGGNLTVTLPDAEDSRGHVFWVKKKAAGNTLTVGCTGSDQIDEAATSAWTTDDLCRAFLACRAGPTAAWGYQVVSNA